MNDGTTKLKTEKQSLTNVIRNLQEKLGKERTSFEKQIKDLQVQVQVCISFSSENNI